MQFDSFPATHGGFVPQMQKKDTLSRVLWTFLSGQDAGGVGVLQHLAAAVVADDLGRTQTGQILVFGRRGLFQAPQLCLVKVLRGGAVPAGVMAK